MKTDGELQCYLQELQLTWSLEHYEPLAAEAARDGHAHADYLRLVLEGECIRRREGRLQRRIKAARFPVVKTLESFNWSWPKKINREQILHMGRLGFLKEHGNVLLLGGVGLGKTHLATALGYAACLEGHTVLFTSTVNMINALLEAQGERRLKTEIKRYTAPRLLVLDEVGYLPIDKQGSDLLFQVISARYERGSIVLTTNKAFKQWPAIFNNDSTITSAVLDRLLHHGEAVILEGASYRTKGKNES